MSEIPVELKYTKTHEWVRVEDDGSLTIGITAHAQDLLGDMVFIEVPEEGTRVSAEDACAVVESVKAASDIYSPVDGEILKGNETLTGAPEKVNADSYDEGWIFSIKPENLSDIDLLMDADAYEAHIAAEAG